MTAFGDDGAASDGTLRQFFAEHRETAADDVLDSSTEVGKRFADAREQAGLGIDEIAHALGVDPVSIREWEAGEASPASKLLNRAAGLLGVSLSWLLIGIGSEPQRGDVDIADVRARLLESLEALRAAELKIENVINRLPSA